LAIGRLRDLLKKYNDLKEYLLNGLYHDEVLTGSEWYELKTMVEVEDSQNSEISEAGAEEIGC
jgi:hypothetical protein